MIEVVRQRGRWCWVKPDNASWRHLRQSFPDCSVESDGTVCVRVTTDEHVRKLEALIAPPT